MAQPSVSEDQIMTVLRSFLLNILPAGTEVIQGQQNRVAPPTGPFVEMTPIMRKRLAVNEQSGVDVAFIGSIAGTVLSAAEILAGEISVGAIISGAGVAPGTEVTALESGTGGSGTYTVAPSQTVASATMQAGVMQALQRTQITVQIDVYGDGTADNAQTISTLFRDPYAVDFFADPANASFEIAPLYSSDPRQTPFISGEQQYQERWTLDAQLQVNPIVAVPAQFADALAVTIVSVDAVFPPT